ncbi:MAG TPA: hypothetical protein VHR55_10965 [Candidatus Limnocylindria bacterium]|nr:hypothetical protein [Candidatus Limnocylindria bacterium]
MNQFDSDFDRPGRFWVTRDPVPLDAALEDAEAAARAAAQRMAADGQEPPAVGEIHRAPQRMLCVSWMDDNPTGLVEMSVPDDWAPPAD